MTLSTSAVAVCCCSDSLKSSVLSRSSRSSRVFSMAMTAWAANCFSSVICFSEKRPLLLPEDHDVADHALVLEQRHGEKATRAPEIDQRPAVGFALAIGIRLEEIGDFDDRFALQQTRGRCARAVFQRLAAAVFVIGGRQPARGGGMEQLTVKRVEHAEIGAAKLHRLAEHRVEDGNEIPGGAADHAQHFGCRGLLLERLRQLLCPCLHLVEQPHVADRDHGLIGEGLQQGDLLVAERMHFGAAKHDRSDALALAQHRHAQDACVHPSGATAPAAFGNSAPSSESTSCTWTGSSVDDRAPGDPVAVDSAISRRLIGIGP